MEKVKAGDKVVIRASTWNAFIDAANWTKEQRQNQLGKGLRSGVGTGIVLMKNGEAWLLGSQFTPLDAACTHTICDPDRTRKLLLNQREIDKLTGFANRKGFTVIPLALYWKGSWVKCEIGICRGKKDYDKREDIKTRDWAREHQRIMKRGGR